MGEWSAWAGGPAAGRLAALFLFEQLAVERLDVVDHLAGAELFDHLQAGPAHLSGALGVVEQGQEGVGEGGGIAPRGEDAVGIPPI